MFCFVTVQLGTPLTTMASQSWPFLASWALVVWCGLIDLVQRLVELHTSELASGNFISFLVLASLCFAFCKALRLAREPNVLWTEPAPPL